MELWNVRITKVEGFAISRMHEICINFSLKIAQFYFKNSGGNRQD